MSDRDTRRGFFALAASLAIAVAVMPRLWLIALGPPRFDSDEGTMGLMSLHIAYHGAHPVFFYGQAYMGALEAYLAAAAFHLVGASILSLRIGLVALYLLFLIAGFLLLDLLYGRRVALVSLAVLGLGSEETWNRELKAVGGYPEMLFLATCTLLIASWLALSLTRQDPPRPWQVRLGFAGCGLVAGAGLWSDPLVVPFILMAALLLLRTCRRRLTAPAIGCVLLGLVIGGFPLLASILTTSPGGSVAEVAAIVRHGGTRPAPGQTSLAGGVAGTVLVSIPVLTGGNALCGLEPQDAWPLSSHSSGRTLACTAVHGAWGTFLLALLVLGMLAPALALRKLRAGSSSPPVQNDREERARQLGRLALLGSGALTLALFMASPAPAYAPWYNVRYLTGLWIAVPAIVAPLVSGFPPIPHRRRSATVPPILSPPLPFRERGPGGEGMRYTLLAIFLLALVIQTVGMFGQSAWVRWQNGRQQALVAELLHLHVRHVYSDYWTCDRLIFESRERIICAVLDERLRPSLDRYLPYRTVVRADPNAAYAFPLGSTQARAMQRKIGPRLKRHAFIADGYVLYLPAAAARKKMPRPIAS